MKTIKFLGIALMAMLLSVGYSSCSKSDDGEKKLGNPLAGTWSGEGHDSNGDAFLAKVVFNADGSGVFSEWELSDSDIDTSNFKYTYTDNTITFNWGDGSPETWTYSISGNKLYLSHSGVDYNLTKQ